MKATLLVLLALFSLSFCAEVVVFGDSWGAFGEDEFQEMFSSRGYATKVDNQAIGGTTAAQWARTPNALSNAVSENRDAKWVWLSIGGNDGIYQLALGIPIEQVVENVINDTQVFVDVLFKDHPDIELVMFGYDVVNFGMSISCRTLGRSIFPECDGDIACTNQGMYNLQYATEQLAAIYVKQGFKFVVHDLRGTLQEASGSVPGPFPNDDYYSPENMMRDCIHPRNSNGWNAIFDKFWELHWSSRV